MGSKRTVEKSEESGKRLGDFWVITSDDPLERTLYVDVEPDCWDGSLTLRDRANKVVAMYAKHVWRRVEEAESEPPVEPGSGAKPAEAPKRSVFDELPGGIGKHPAF
jgi:hypothetical protein